MQILILKKKELKGLFQCPRFTASPFANLKQPTIEIDNSIENYLMNNNSLYLGNVHNWSSTINSNLSIW